MSKILISFNGKETEVTQEDIQAAGSVEVAVKRKCAELIGAQRLVDVPDEQLSEKEIKLKKSMMVRRLSKGNTYGLKIDDYELQLLDGLILYPEGGIVQNPFSGDKVTLSAEALSVYDLIKGCEITKDGQRHEAALDVFLKNWPTEYMQLID